MSEVLWPDGSPHPTNSRATIIDDPDSLVRFRAGIFPLQGRPAARVPQRGISSSAGANITRVWASPAVGDVAREIVDKHLDLCLYAGVNHEGINAEVAKGQWEFQIFGKGSKRAADDVWVARYLMARLGETYGVDLETPLQAHSRRLERFGNALQLFDQVHARSRRKRIFREAHGRF